MKKLIYLIIFLFAYHLSFGQSLLDTAVNFSVKDIYGNNIQLFPMLDEGKLVVIDFFNTSCGPCGLYAPDFQASYEDFGENEGNVFFMQIAWGDDNDGVAYFDSIHGITAPSVSGSEGGGNQVYTNYMIQATPTVILISPDRLILEHHIWEPTTENINAAVIAAGGSLLDINDGLTDQDSPLHIYPNPSTGVINIRLDLEKSAEFRIEVFDLRGTMVFEAADQHYNAGVHELKIDLAALPGGTYFVRQLQNGKQLQSGRLILLD